MNNNISGVVLKRKLARLPKRRCWFVGFSTCSNQEDDTGSINVAENFTNAWNTDLIIGKRDCRHFTNGIVYTHACFALVINYSWFFDCCKLAIKTVLQHLQPEKSLLMFKLQIHRSPAFNKLLTVTVTPNSFSM